MSESFNELFLKTDVLELTVLITRRIGLRFKILEGIRSHESLLNPSSESEIQKIFVILNLKKYVNSMKFYSKKLCVLDSYNPIHIIRKSNICQT